MPTTKEHVLRVEKVSWHTATPYYFKCSCGRSGAAWPTKEAALKQGEDHVEFQTSVSVLTLRIPRGYYAPLEAWVKRHGGEVMSGREDGD